MEDPELQAYWASGYSYSAEVEAQHKSSRWCACAWSILPCYRRILRWESTWNTSQRDLLRGSSALPAVFKHQCLHSLLLWHLANRKRSRSPRWQLSCRSSASPLQLISPSRHPLLCCSSGRTWIHWIPSVYNPKQITSRRQLPPPGHWGWSSAPQLCLQNESIHFWRIFINCWGFDRPIFAKMTTLSPASMFLQSFEAIWHISQTNPVCTAKPPQKLLSINLHSTWPSAWFARRLPHPALPWSAGTQTCPKWESWDKFYRFGHTWAKRALD